MNKRRYTTRLAAAALAAAVLVGSGPAATMSMAAEKAPAAVTQNLGKAKTGWVTKKGYTYYYNSNGKKITGRQTIGNSTYYFDKKGRMVKGWLKLGSKYYYLDRKSGKMALNKKVDSIKLDKNGAAKKAGKDTYNQYKIETMIRAKKRMEQLTKPTDSKSEKKQKCFNYFLSASGVPYDASLGSLSSVRAGGKNWDLRFANEIFQHGHGDCVAMSCAFAYLAHECGYKTVYICDDGEHGWVEISGKVYDPLFARTPSKRARSTYYAISYGEYGLSASNKKKV